MAAKYVDLGTYTPKEVVELMAQCVGELTLTQVAKGLAKGLTADDFESLGFNATKEHYDSITKEMEGGDYD
jgi:hypothetical protein